MTIRAIVVDDEPPAREKLRRYLSAEPDVEVVGEAADGASAAAAIARLTPDVVFLDVVMPGIDGFEVLRRLDSASLPHVVFVTAHDDHALRAFEVNALDYVLKPVDPDRFRLAVARVRERRGRPLRRLLVGGPERLQVLDVAAIDWSETAGNYTVLHAGGHTHTVRRPLTRLLARLDPERFIRIHRTLFVNIDRVREVRPISHGDCAIVLDDGTELTLSRRFRSNVWRRFQQ
jgi:two-component system, LytTR family, response regulator